MPPAPPTGRRERQARLVPQDLPVLLDRRAESFVLSMESVAKPASLRARTTSASSKRLPSIRGAPSFSTPIIRLPFGQSSKIGRLKSFSHVLGSDLRIERHTMTREAAMGAFAKSWRTG